MKQKITLCKRSFVIFAAIFYSCCVYPIDQQISQVNTEIIPVAESNKSLQMGSEQIQELRARLAAVQAQLNEIDKAILDECVTIHEKEHARHEHAVGKQITNFLKDNVFSLSSLACTIYGLYMSYHFNQQSLKYSRASFLIDKGDAAFKNIALVDQGQYAQYKMMVDQAKKQIAA